MAFLVNLFTLSAPLNAEEIYGKVTSAAGVPLAGVNIVLEGTPHGTATDSTGHYRVAGIQDGYYRVTASRVGFMEQSKEVYCRGVLSVNFVLRESVVELSEVTVTGTMATAATIPVTYTHLRREEIARHYTIQDIPLLLTYTPGVYVTTDGGAGLGDSRIFIRGFDEERVQVLVNNIPVNDPESKKVFWSNWGMLAGVAQSIQVQRGVGSSLYGSGGLGGVINIITEDASPVRSSKFNAVVGQYGVRRAGLTYHSGLVNPNRSLMASVNYLEGNGWRENTFYRGVHYYISATLLPDPGNVVKLVLYGAPQYHSLSHYTFSAATYGERGQFGEKSNIDGGAGMVNAYGHFAYGFGRKFNGNVHLPETELPSTEQKRATTIWQPLLLKGKIGVSPERQVGGYIVANGRASLNNNVSHRPQLEVHHNWQMSQTSRLTSTFFLTRGVDYSDDVYPYWFIPRDSSGSFHYTDLIRGDYYGAEQVFQYRYYSDFLQTGFLSAYKLEYQGHTLSTGVEGRRWKSRHAGEVLNTLGRPNVGVPVGSVDHRFQEGELFYDFDTAKDQITLFGHGMWHLGRASVMTNVQYTTMAYHIVERVPSNKNYPNHMDPSAISTHGGGRWIKNATWDHDGDTTTAQVPVEYTLWDYRRLFRYFAPRLGIDYELRRGLHIFVSGGIGVKEPRVKHFFGYGSPWENIDLEKTRELGSGLKFRGQVMNLPVDLDLSWYYIEFSGKVMEITDPEKANKPGYDYAGHYYVPIGQATYSGTEVGLTLYPRPGVTVSLTVSKASNMWGEPDGFEGAQKLYANVALSGVDFLDEDSDGVWDEGGSEYPLHRKFVDKYGARYEVGMPQFMVGSEVLWAAGPWEINLGLRHHEDLYVLEDNSPIRIGAGPDDIFGTGDDRFSATLPPVTVLDLRLGYMLPAFGKTVKLSLHMNNVLDTHYWQRGDEYGVAPGPARILLFNLGLQT